jgi:hypothetical protein
MFLPARLQLLIAHSHIPQFYLGPTLLFFFRLVRNFFRERGSLAVMS